MDININYTFQSSSKNVIFYKCKKRPICPGKTKLDVKTKEITIITKCDKNIKHDELTLEEFQTKYKIKNFEGINFDLKKYHRFYIKAMILSEKFIDIPTAIKEFKKEIQD